MIRNGNEGDLERIMAIYKFARDLMKKSGNPDQWTNGYPEEWRVKEDIAMKTNFVLEREGVVKGVFVLLEDGDPDYLNIHQGQWLNDKAYGAIHRVASCTTGKGLTKEIFDWSLNRCHNIKIDTHKDNKIMQHVLIKNGFKRCGLVYIRGAGERIAYQKNLDIK
jgi:RimJ/RimL family protein N-acetyltransferase